MIRTIRVEEITKNIKEMCIEANHFLSPDMAEAMKCAEKNEEAPLGKQILEQLQENLKIAGEDMIPICQDTGMAVVFLEIGQDVHLEGGALEDAVNEGVRQGYVEGYLRKSVVGDPLIRENTKDNTLGTDTGCGVRRLFYYGSAGWKYHTPFRIQSRRADRSGIVRHRSITLYTGRKDL